MPKYTLDINGEKKEVSAPADMPLLWVLRYQLGLVGAKYGCGIAQCGACTVLLNGQPSRSCVTQVAQSATAKITTVEGLAQNGRLTPLQQAWCDHDVAQCGYCQAGQLLSATALLAATPKPSDTEIDAAMTGNLCRCATYTRIRSAIKAAAGLEAPPPGATAITK
jgi:isoquinoline 1-oxidoreductase subunit alpha